MHTDTLYSCNHSIPRWRHSAPVPPGLPSSPLQEAIQSGLAALFTLSWPIESCHSSHNSHSREREEIGSGSTQRSLAPPKVPGWSLHCPRQDSGRSRRSRQKQLKLSRSCYCYWQIPSSAFHQKWLQLTSQAPQASQLALL